ncbi:hypothetical protein [Natrinema versiforme]|uniref:Uncharacterized protein n=1 Tax=Natrinema versiforme TaxID=88724 RepID=A0A4P8WKE4_9EURY|nr:hypothetical protein [Natrinema versiforme]QCS42573.1 hypothetical protein FEJ81_09450 [Natrinema versiforme]
MDCLFCGSQVRFDQHKMAHRIFEVSDTENKWWLCRDCAEIRDRGDKTKGLSGAGGTCIDCEEEAAYAITLLKKTPRGDVESDGTVFHVLCETHFDERKGE